MLKPLLKVLPTLSGNVKLVCEVNKYEQVSNDTFNGYVRSAKMLPLSSQLSTKPINIFLSTSSYEIDIKNALIPLTASLPLYFLTAFNELPLVTPK